MLVRKGRDNRRGRVLSTEEIMLDGRMMTMLALSKATGKNLFIVGERMAMAVVACREGLMETASHAKRSG